MQLCDDYLMKIVICYRLAVFELIALRLWLLAENSIISAQVMDKWLAKWWQSVPESIKNLLIIISRELPSIGERLYRRLLVQIMPTALKKWLAKWWQKAKWTQKMSKEKPSKNGVNALFYWVFPLARPKELESPTFCSGVEARHLKRTKPHKRKTSKTPVK